MEEWILGYATTEQIVYDVGPLTLQGLHEAGGQSPSGSWLVPRLDSLVETLTDVTAILPTITESLDYVIVLQFRVIVMALMGTRPTDLHLAPLKQRTIVACIEMLTYVLIHNLRAICAIFPLVGFNVR